MSCKNICKNYKFSRKGITGMAYYANGASRCQSCGGVWLVWSGLYCPCCNMQLRKGSRCRNKVAQYQANKVMK